jgi:hypothetical protein
MFMRYRQDFHKVPPMHSKITETAKRHIATNDHHTTKRWKALHQCLRRYAPGTNNGQFMLFDLCDLEKSSKVHNGAWHYMAIIPPKDEKPSINGYRDMVRKWNIRLQMKFQDGHLPGGPIRKEKIRIFTLNLPSKFGDHWPSHLGVMRWYGHAHTHTQPTIRTNMVLSFLRRSGTIINTSINIYLNIPFLQIETWINSKRTGFFLEKFRKCICPTESKN